MTDSARQGVIVGVDLGGTATRFVALDETDTVLGSETRSTPTDASEADAVAFIADGIGRATAGRPLAGIGIGASGPIAADGVIRNPDTLPAFSGIELIGGLEERFGVHPVIENDAVTAAIHETTLGAAAGCASALIVTIGTGIGVAAIIDGLPVRGADGMHPESGHQNISGPPAPCYCGRQSCWEQLASRRALQHQCEELLGGALSGAAAIRECVSRAGLRDSESVALFDRFGGYLAQGVQDLLTVHRVECLVLAGSGAAYFEAYEHGFTSQLAATAAGHPTPRIARSRSADTSGALGAALWARRSAAVC